MERNMQIRDIIQKNQGYIWKQFECAEVFKSSRTEIVPGI